VSSPLPSHFLPAVQRFYFDIRDGEQFIRDDEGLDCPDIKAARDLATVALAEMAKEALPRAERHHIAIEVRDEAERAAAVAGLTFEVRILR
jgi:CBS-domain-containing membrane protein